jgi:hypothetical protein
MPTIPKIHPLPRYKINPGTTYDIARCALGAIDPDDKAEVIAPAIADHLLELTAWLWKERKTYYLDTIEGAGPKRRPAGIATRDRATTKRWLIKALLLGCRVTCDDDPDDGSRRPIGIADWRESQRQQNTWDREREASLKGCAPKGDIRGYEKRMAALVAEAAAYRKQFEKAPLTKAEKARLLSGAGKEWYCHSYDARDPAFIKELADEPERLVRLPSCDCENFICKVSDAAGMSAREYDQYLRQHRPTAEEVARIEAKD